MTPQHYTEAELFDLLEHPEQWPDDPECQAELAALLELHLGLKAHPDELHAALEAQSAHAWYRRPWMAVAATLLFAVVPSVLAVRSVQNAREMARDVEHRQEVASRRTQDRLWAKFLDQSMTLLKDFERNAEVCSRDGEMEDRTAERELALALLDSSRQLQAIGAPAEKAEAVRNNLHLFLTELSYEDACMDPARAKELREWARNHNLQEEAERLARTIEREHS